MRLHRMPRALFPALALLSVLSLPLGARAAGATPAAAPSAASARETDPFAPVYIVSSRKTYQSLQLFARNGVSRRDSLGNELVVSEVKAHQLGEVSEWIHQRERRCGGYFAFRSRKEADAFIAGDRAARAVAAPLLPSYTIDNGTTVNPWLGQVSETNLYGTMNTLQGYQNRYYTSSTGKTSAEWIRNTWQNLAGSRSDVTTELYTACGNCSTQPSVILTIQGSSLPGEIVVLGAHLDSINVSASGSTSQRAPGADDDGSGIATLTEVIRIALADGWRPQRTVKFMGYAAEEVGLRGSNAIANDFKASGKNVVGVMQLDMTNYKSGSVPDMQLVTDYSSTELKNFLVALFDAYLAPLGHTRSTYTCGYACSDHASWTSAGYPAAMMFEAGDANGYNPNIHGSGDTLANMGDTASHSVKFAKLGLAFLGELAKTAGSAGNVPPVANFSATASGLTATFTDSSSDSDGSIAARSWDFGDGTTSTATNPSHAYAAAGTYNVTLTVTDNAGATGSRTQAVTVGGNVLSNGVPASNISGAAGSSQYWTLDVPGNAGNLRFTTSGGSGDADLYVKFGAQPSTTSYDCKSDGSTTTEACNIAVAQAGKYYVLLKGYSAFSGLSLTGSYSIVENRTTYSNTTDYPINDNATVDSPITVSGRSGNAPSDVSVTVAIVHTYIGDLKVDLVAPDGSLYNIHNRTGSSTDNINKTVTLNLSTEALNGTWKLRVNDNASQDTGYINSWSITF